MPPKERAVSSAPSSRPIPGKKREQIPVACDGCRRRKTKCTGRRPVCSECEAHQIDCHYAYEPGEAPFPALKRKFDALQSQSADEHDLIGLLRSSSDHDAIQVLADLRTGTVSSALRMARSLPPQQHETPPPQAGRTPRDDSQSESTNMYPDPREAAAGAMWTLPIEPSTRGHNLESTSRPKMIRKIPSAPNIASAPLSMLISIRERSPKRPVSKSDPRLDRAKTKDWGIEFLDDNDFRKIITSYFVWEHPVWGVFHTDDFCNALAGEPSDLSSRLLVFAVLAIAARFYIYFDPKLSTVHHKAWEEARHLWQEAINNGDNSIATACAGATMCTLYCITGIDKLGRDIIITSQKILLNNGFYDPRLIHETYGDISSWKAKTRATIAWSMLDYVTYVEITTKSQVWLVPKPPVPVPCFKIRADSWSPWPSLQPIVPAYTNELALARAQLNSLVRDVDLLRRKHQDLGITQMYFDESTCLHRRFQEWLNSLEPCLHSTEFASQQLIILHIWYHFAIIELFRPFTSSIESESEVGVKFATPSSEAASASAVQQLRQLFVRREALYGGLSTHCLLASPILAVAFEAMPKASPAGAEYSPSAHMAFLTAIRALIYMSRSTPVVNLAILAIQQAATRSGVSLPSEAYDYFKEATNALSKEKSDSENDEFKNSADWVVDLSRSAHDLESARLGRLVAEMEKLNVQNDGGGP